MLLLFHPLFYKGPHHLFLRLVQPLLPLAEPFLLQEPVVKQSLQRISGRLRLVPALFRLLHSFHQQLAALPLLALNSDSLLPAKPIVHGFNHALSCELSRPALENHLTNFLLPLQGRLDMVLAEETVEVSYVVALLRKRLALWLSDSLLFALRLAVLSQQYMQMLARERCFETSGRGKRKAPPPRRTELLPLR